MDIPLDTQGSIQLIFQIPVEGKKQGLSKWPSAINPEHLDEKSEASGTSQEYAPFSDDGWEFNESPLVPADIKLARRKSTISMLPKVTIPLEVQTEHNNQEDSDGEEIYAAPHEVDEPLEDFSHTYEPLPADFTGAKVFNVALCVNFC